MNMEEGEALKEHAKLLISRVSWELTFWQS